MERRPYPSDVSDEEWAFVAPSVTLMTEEAPQREHRLRDVFHGLRWIVRTGAQWRMMPHDLPPWSIGYQQTQRWLRAGVCEAIMHELRAVLRLAAGRKKEPSAAMFDSRTLPSTPESGHRAGSEGAKRRKGSNIPAAVDPLGNRLALHVTPASDQDRAQVGERAEAVQHVTGGMVELACVDAGSTGTEPAQAAQAPGMRLEVVTWSEAKRGFVLLPTRWVVERSFAWTTRFRRLVRDSERWPETLAGLHLLAFVVLLLHRCVLLLVHASYVQNNL